MKKKTQNIGRKLFGWYELVISSIFLGFLIVTFIIAFNKGLLIPLYYFQYAIGLILGVVGLFGGIFLLKNKSSGFTLSLIWSFLQIFSMIQIGTFWISLQQLLWLGFSLGSPAFFIKINFIGIALIVILVLIKRKNLIS